MIRRIETWLVSIFHTELAAVLTEIASVRAELAAVRLELKNHVTNAAESVQTHAEQLHDEIKAHMVEVAADIHQKIAADAKAVLRFQQTARLGCSFCGQLSRTYTVETSGKIKCADCRQKGRT